MSDQNKWKEYEARKAQYKAWQRQTGNYSSEDYDKFITKLLKELNL